jgi:hypothetical protein
VTDFGRRTTMGVLEQTVIQQVGFKYRGVGRMVYPGLLQLASFMSMNAQTHSQSFVDQIFRAAKGEAVGPRQAQRLLRRIPRRHGHDGRVLPFDRGARLQGREIRAQRLRR